MNSENRVCRLLVLELVPVLVPVLELVPVLVLVLVLVEETDRDN